MTIACRPRLASHDVPFLEDLFQGPRAGGKVLGGYGGPGSHQGVAMNGWRIKDGQIIHANHGKYGNTRKSYPYDCQMISVQTFRGHGYCCTVPARPGQETNHR